MKKENLNLEILKRSRKRTKPGDIFVFKPKSHEYYFGRTISVNAQVGTFKDCVLIYLYNAYSKDKTHIPELSKHNLLLPPLMTNYSPWTRGYFETVDYKALTDDDIFHPHCFYDDLMKCYVDENNNTLNKAYEPVGDYWLSRYIPIDVEISHALGIPLAEDHPYTQFCAEIAAKKAKKAARKSSKRTSRKSSE